MNPADTADANVAVDRLAINTIRTLSMDAVQAANSGHPGTPMALAPLGYRIFTKHLRFNPDEPDWIDRDRFVLSCGHASMLLYSLLYLSGYEVKLDDLRNFRQLNSPTAGHPEYGYLPGIETTTGPLGQGLANAVGMALAERMLAARLNDPTGETLIDHHTWVLASDGDLMEGVQAEAASLAGHLGLGRLIVFWDDNRITIDGTTDQAFTEDVGQRYEAYGWQVLYLHDVDDLDAIDDVIARAKADPRPTLVATRTHIGIGSPLEDSPKAHGAPLGDENIRITKENYGWAHDDAFHVPQEALAPFEAAADRGRAHWTSWEERLQITREASPDVAAELDRLCEGRLPDDWDAGLQRLQFSDGEKVATRVSSGHALNAIATAVPELVGGSADLGGSNNTDLENGGFVQAGAYGGRNIHFGVREHGMAAIANGMALHSLRPYVATFLVFADYMRPSMRLSAVMHQPVTYVMTHDSVYLGEDGPTHQPIEHLAMLRATPGLTVLRPADARETAAAWRWALAHGNGPNVLALTRQGVPTLPLPLEAGLPPVHRGAYVAAEFSAGGARQEANASGTLDRPDAIVIATGSEVWLSIDAAARASSELGLSVRVVSMPSMEIFAGQAPSWRDQVLPPDVTRRVAVEAAASFGWERWVGDAGRIIAIDRFGTSAPGNEAAASLGITVDAIVEALS